MKNMKLRVFAILICTTLAVSFAMPAAAGGGELSMSSTVSEEEVKNDPEMEGSPAAGRDLAEEGGTEADPAAEDSPAEPSDPAAEADPAVQSDPEAGGDPGKEERPAAESGQEGEDRNALQAISAETVSCCKVALRETEGGRASFREEPEELTEKWFETGETVLLTVVPDPEYRVESVRILYESGDEDTASYREEDTCWEFVMREGNAWVECRFVHADEDPGNMDTVSDPSRSEENAGEGSDKQDGEETGSETEDPDITEDSSEGDEDEDADENKDSEPAASTRLLVKTEDAGLLDAEAVIGVIGDVYLLQFDSREAAGEALASYEDAVEFAAEDITIRTSSYGEFSVSDQEADPVMTEADNPFAEAQQAVPASSSGRLIALIDTGVSPGQTVSGLYSVIGEDPYDGNGHGDAMLRTIRGFDTDAEVVSIKALDNNGLGTVSSLYAAVRMAIDMHASVINLSLSAYSTGENEAVASVIREAAANGITVVGAAGNNGTDAGSYIPACVPEAVIAGACNKEGQRLPSSNYGSTVDLYILAGSSSYAAATLSGIISATGGVPAPDGIAVFSPGSLTASSDYVDGLCYDGMSGNFQKAGVTYTLHNTGGRRLTDLIPGLTYDSLKAWLGSHENDNYYLDTPYPERIVNGVPQYILGRNGDCDNRNPNGDCGGMNGNDDYPGTAMMNCTGFVWHALWKASGLSYADGIARIPAWGGIGAGSWKSFIQNNGLEYMTVKSGGAGEINEMLGTAMWSAKGPDGKLFLEKGDIIWFWVSQIPLGTDDLPVNGYYGGLADKAHVGIYWPEEGTQGNRWWDSIGICEYQGDSGVYLRNMLHGFTPKTATVAMTIIKLGRSQPVLTKVNVQKTSSNSAMTEGNACYSMEGAVYAVYKNRSDAEAMTSPVTTFFTDDTGYGESEEVLEAGKEYFLRETEAPSNGSFLLDPAIYPVKAVEPEKVKKESALQIPEVPAADQAAVVIEKVSSDGVPAKDAKPLAGVQFTIRYYKGEYRSPDELPAPARTWVIETGKQPDGSYRASLDPEHKISGDDFYFLSGSQEPVLPLGTITIEETKAAEGYQMENKWKNGDTAGTGVYFAVIAKNGDAVQLTFENTVIAEDGFTASDTPIRGGVKIRKLDGDMKLDMDGKPYAEGDKSLAGAKFTICSKNTYVVKNKDGNSVAPGGIMQVIAADETGAAETGTRDLPYGTYEIRETEASPGYKINSSWVRTFRVEEEGKRADLTKEADICYEPDIKGGVLLQKADLELGKAEALGGASLGGIIYQIRNASAHAVKNRDGEIVQTGGLVQEIVTDRDGIAATGDRDLPYGTYILHELTTGAGELSANDSYLGRGAADITFRIREDGKTVTLDKDGNDIIFTNQVKRNDLSFRKAENGSDRAMGSIPFVIENTVTGEKHVVVTDQNGMYSSTKYAHCRNTNRNDILLENYTGESIIEETEMDHRAGTWFGMGQNGSEAEADDILPAFPYGRYTITELRCEANAGYELIKNYPFEIREDIEETGGEKLTLNTLHNIPVLPEIRTRALDDKTGEHVMLAETEASLTDTVSAINLQKGENYTLCATLMEEETASAVRIRDTDGNMVKVTGETAFTADSASMEIPVKISLNAEELAGKTIVVYEQLFLAEEDGSRTPVAEHREIADAEQMISIPEIRTTFRDTETESQIGTPEEEQKVEDTVWYTGLIPGKEVSVTATVMTVSETGDPVELRDKDGNPFTETLTFIPEKSEGSVKIAITIDSSLLAGKKAVCFEEICYEEIPVAVHADIGDQDQTIWYPDIRTTATDRETGEHVASVSGEGIFIDVIAYKGLKPDETYTAEAVLMDAESGEPIKENGKEVTARTTFTPKTESGEISVEIPVNTKAIAGKNTVVFEELYMGEHGSGNGENEEGSPAAEHKDLNDEGQQIRVPEIRTTLTDTETGSHTAGYGKKVKLTDTVVYSGLIPGKVYRLSAVLMTVDKDGKESEWKDADGKPYTAEKTFRAKEAAGEEKVTFTVDTTGLAGEKAVCFETLYLEDVKLAVHADIGDADQTVTAPSIRTNARDVVSGMHIASDGNTVFVDTISYSGLTPGVMYVASGTLMNAETGKAVSAGGLKALTGETEFIPDKPDGTVDVSFRLSTGKLSGVTVVVFEELFRRTDSGKKVPAAEHKDLNDKDQQVHVPKIRTTASVKGEKECVAGADTVLTDTVSYNNIVPGGNYILRGKLVDKKSGQTIRINNKVISAEKSFTASSGQGSEEMTFTFDSTLLKGRTVVVFEDLYLLYGEGQEVKIASHADVKDTEQSVVIRNPKATATPAKTPAPKAGQTASQAGVSGGSAPATGDPGRIRLYLLLLGAAAAAGAGLYYVRKKRMR